MQYDVAN